MAGVEVASVGPATTEAAQGLGLTVGLASAGSQAALVADLVRHYGEQGGGDGA
jgi:uroporphyrinogen-III synthase